MFDSRNRDDMDAELDAIDGFDIEMPEWSKSHEPPRPASSVGTSASELLFADLSEKTRLLKIASDEAHQYKLCCRALRAELATARKRPRDVPIDGSIPSADQLEVVHNPRKRPSPEVLASATANVNPRAPPANASDDEVPLPTAPKARKPKPATRNRLFEQLQSVLCGYKDEKIIPGSVELPFSICAALCRDEAAAVKEWGTSKCNLYHKPILSALRLVYPNKRPEWFRSGFLLRSDDAAKYWVKVLDRRAEIWEAAAKRVENHPAPVERPLSLKEKIRKKIAERRELRTGALKSSLRTVGFTNPFKTPASKPAITLSSSGSDNDIVDLSKSPAASSELEKSKSTAPSPPKMAPEPK